MTGSGGNRARTGRPARGCKIVTKAAIRPKVWPLILKLPGFTTGQGPHCVAAALALGDEPAQAVKNPPVDSPRAYACGNQILIRAAPLSPTRCLRFHLTCDESQQISVDALRIDDRNTVGATWVDLEDRMRNDRGYAARGRADWHDLIVFAMQDQ